MPIQNFLRPRGGIFGGGRNLLKRAPVVVDQWHAEVVQRLEHPLDLRGERLPLHAGDDRERLGGVDRCEQEKRDETTNGKQSFHGEQG